MRGTLKASETIFFNQKDRSRWVSFEVVKGFDLLMLVSTTIHYANGQRIGFSQRITFGILPSALFSAIVLYFRMAARVRLWI